MRRSGDELGQAFPLLPLLEAFGIRSSPPDPRRLRVLRALRGPGAEAGVEAAAAAVEALLDLVDQLCAESPAFLVVDGLHWVDAASVAVCHRLACSAAQRPLLLIVAMRPLPRCDDIAALRREIGGHALCRFCTSVTYVARCQAAPPGLRRCYEGFGHAALTRRRLGVHLGEHRRASANCPSAAAR